MWRERRTVNAMTLEEFFSRKAEGYIMGAKNKGKGNVVRVLWSCLSILISNSREPCFKTQSMRPLYLCLFVVQ